MTYQFFIGFCRNTWLLSVMSNWNYIHSYYSTRGVLTTSWCNLKKNPPKVRFFSLWQFCSGEISRTAIHIGIRFFISGIQKSSSVNVFAGILIFDQNTGKNAGFIKKKSFFQYFALWITQWVITWVSSYMSLVLSCRTSICPSFMDIGASLL